MLKPPAPIPDGSGIAVNLFAAAAGSAHEGMMRSGLNEGSRNANSPPAAQLPQELDEPSDAFPFSLLSSEALALR